MTAYKHDIRGEISRLWSLPPPTRIWEWAEKNVNLGHRQITARKGMYRTSVTPYVRGIFDAVQDPTVHTVTICKGTQTGLTLLAFILVAYWVSEDPDPVLIVFPSGHLAQWNSENRLQVLLRDCEPSSQVMDTDSDMTRLEYRTKHTVVSLVGANSAANLSSRPVRYLILDEVDKYPPTIKSEASPVSLAVERTKTYDTFKKIIEISTPTTERGYIWQSYLRGDQRKYIVPCPACGKMQPVAFSNLAFKRDKTSIQRSAETALWKCSARTCGKTFDQGQFAEAVQRGEWQATVEATEAGHVSMQLPSWFSPWVTLSEVVSKFLNSKDAVAELQNFVNSTCAEPWKEPPKKQVAESSVRRRQRACIYERGTVPTSERVILYMTTDRQTTHLVWTVWAANLGNQWLVDHGYAATWEDVPGVWANRYQDVQGRTLRVSRMMLDTGYDTVNAYRFCLQYPNMCLAIKGEQGIGTRQDRPVRASTIDRLPGVENKRKSKINLTLLHVHPTHFKDALTDALAEDAPAQKRKAKADPLQRPKVHIWFHREIDDDFVRQMCGEVVRESKPDKFGATTLYYEKVHTNDYFDCAQYAFAFRYVHHMDLLALNRPDAPEVDAQQPERPRQQTTIGDVDFGDVSIT